MSATMRQGLQTATQGPALRSRTEQTPLLLLVAGTALLLLLGLAELFATASLLGLEPCERVRTLALKLPTPALQDMLCDKKTHHHQ